MSNWSLGAGLIGGFAWLVVVRLILLNWAGDVSPEAASWLTFGGLAAVWLVCLAAPQFLSRHRS